MKSRIWLASLLGAFTMFIWLSVAHMALGLGEAGMQQIPNDGPVLDAMKSTISAHGTYFFPHMDPKEDMAAYSHKLETGPSGLLIYYPTHHFNYGSALLVEFLTEFVLVLVAVYLLTLTRLTTFAGKVGFFAAIGLCVACATNVQYWNWYGFSVTYTLASCFTGLVGYILAGVVVAWLKVSGEKTV